MEPIRFGQARNIAHHHNVNRHASGDCLLIVPSQGWRVGAEIGTPDTVYPDSIWTLTIDARRKLTTKDVMEWAGA